MDYRATINWSRSAGGASHGELRIAPAASDGGASIAGSRPSGVATHGSGECRLTRKKAGRWS